MLLHIGGNALCSHFDTGLAAWGPGPIWLLPGRRCLGLSKMVFTLVSLAVLRASILQSHFMPITLGFCILSLLLAVDQECRRMPRSRHLIGFHDWLLGILCWRSKVISGHKVPCLFWWGRRRTSSTEYRCFVASCSAAVSPPC